MATKTANYNPPDNIGELVLAWIRRAREANMQHEHRLESLLNYNNKLGVVVVVITAIVGVNAFSSLLDQFISPYGGVVIGFACVLASVLSALQTYFKFVERAGHHRQAANQYNALRRKLEVYYASGCKGVSQDNLWAVKEELDQLATKSPSLCVSDFKKIQENDFFSSLDTKDKEKQSVKSNV